MTAVPCISCEAITDVCAADAGKKYGTQQQQIKWKKNSIEMYITALQITNSVACNNPETF
jgi:hypothetical protein